MSHVGRAPPGNEAARRSRDGEAEPKRFISNSSADDIAEIDGRTQPRDAAQQDHLGGYGRSDGGISLSDLRFRRDVERARAKPVQPLYEILAELGRDHLIRTAIETKVAKYASRLTPEMLRITGGDWYVPLPLHLVEAL